MTAEKCPNPDKPCILEGQMDRIAVLLDRLEHSATIVEVTMPAMQRHIERLDMDLNGNGAPGIKKDLQTVKIYTQIAVWGFGIIASVWLGKIAMAGWALIEVGRTVKP